MTPDDGATRLTPERWREVEALFLATRDRAPVERAAFLTEACGTDLALRREVESLLAADQGATGFLESSRPIGPLPSEFETALRAALSGRYLIERELGRGGMATVYLAEDVRHQRQVAIKVLNPELGAVLGAERFLREIGIVARLSHPHILPLHDSGTLDIGLPRPVLFYAMPYVAGRSLRERLREELQLPLQEAIGIARQVAAALDHAHRQGVVHRDIKPENILLADGQAVLADFGIARALDVAAGDRLTETGLAIGTPAYMSPEQSAGTARLDGRSDIYALGCVLYEMVGGQPPFLGPTPQAILARHALDPVPSLRTLRPTVPRAVAHVVTRALAKVPADRFPTAREFGEALAGAMAAPAEEDAEPGAPGTRSRAARSRRWVIAAVAVAVIAAAALAAALARRPPANLDPTRVLVVPFQNRTGDSTLDALSDVAADYVIRGLRTTGKVVEVVDARSHGTGGAMRGLSVTAARAAASADGAGTIVVGAYDRTPGDSVQFQAEVLETGSGRALRSIGPVAAPLAVRMAALDGLRSRVMAAVGSLLDFDFSEQTSRPETYESYQEWSAGAEVSLHCGGQPECQNRALGHFYRAFAMDSAFTLPLTYVAWNSYGNNCARVDSMAAILSPRLLHLPPEDAAQLKIASGICHGDLPAALDGAAGPADNHPDNERLRTWKAMLLLYSNRPREAIPLLEPIDETRARDPELNLRVLFAAYHRAGMYDRALAKIGEMRRLKLNSSADLRWLYLREEAASLAGLGRVADATRKIDEMVRLLGAEQQGIAVIGLMDEAGRELAAHGQAAAARQAFDRATAWASALAPAQQATTGARQALAEVLNSAGRWDEARTLYRALAAEDSTDTDVQAALGDLAARRGDRAEASRIDRWLAARGGTGPAGATSEYWALYQRARIAGLLGDHDRAIGLLREAEQRGFAGWRTAHLDPDLTPLRADPAFQQWIRPRD